MRKIITLIILALTTTQIYSHDYQVLNQGNTETCVSHAINTYIDYVTEPTDLDPFEVYAECKGYIAKTLDYYLEQGEIIGYEEVTEIEYPLLAIVYFDRADWKDGIIKSKGKTLHAIVLIGQTDYLIGINSYGTRWGFNGLCRIYNEDIIYKLYRLEFEVYH